MNKLKIYPNTKQLIALPLKGKIKEMFLDELARQVKELYPAKSLDDFVDAVSFYDHRAGMNRLFKLDATPVDNPANFELVYEEDGFCEINCFKVHTKEFNEELIFKWSSE